MAYFEHTVGSHSDDRGGDSDLPCYCTRDTEVTIHSDNQKPDKQEYQCVACGFKVKTSDLSSIRCFRCEYKGFELVDDQQQDTTLREQLRTDMHFRGIRDLYLDDTVQSILDLLAKRIPKQKGKAEPGTYYQYRIGFTTGYNQALSEVRAIIEGKDGS